MQNDNIDIKSKDDQDFLYSYGDIRSQVVSDAYRKNFDRIFRQDVGQVVELVDETPLDVLDNGEK